MTDTDVTQILSQIEQELPVHPVIPLLQLKGGFEIVEMKIPDEAGVLGTSAED